MATLYDNFSQVRQYIDQERPDLSAYVSKSELSAQSYLTAVPADYVTETELSAMGYATTTDLSNHLPYLGTLQAHYTNSEHFLPKTNNTYYLGNSNFKWQLAYTYNLYAKDVYADNAYISNYNNLIWTGTSAEYAALDNYTSYQIYMIKES